MKTEVSVPTLYQMACGSESHVLISGPTGSGKSRLARQIHESSGRKTKPFVIVNLACLHEGTIESELFGHERGAFTGAENKRMGRLELAQGGTIFLDEVGELTPRLQARLLEFLQSKTVVPVGGNRETKLDVRVIAATHKNLEKATLTGEFREDLFYRLRVLEIRLKSINERHMEFDEIVHQCLREICESLGRSILKISEELAEKLEAYHWPGNFRELRNVLEFAVLSSAGYDLTVGNLPEWFCDKLNARTLLAAEPLFGSALSQDDLLGRFDYETALRAFEKTYIQRALERYRWRVNFTARRIGMNKTTLIRRMRAYGMSAPFEMDAALN